MDAVISFFHIVTNQFVSEYITEFDIFKLFEIIAFVTGIFYIILMAKAHKQTYIWGILGCILLTVCWAKQGLIGQTLLYIYYVLISFYGLFSWTNKNKETKEVVLKVQSLGLKKNILFLGFNIVMSLAFMLVVTFLNSKGIINSRFVALDTTLTVFSLSLSYIQTKKYIDNWVYWFVVDGTYTYLCIKAGLYFLTLLMLFYTVMCIYGFIEWKALKKKNM